MIQSLRFTVSQEETSFMYMQLLHQVMKWNTSCTMSLIHCLALSAAVAIWSYPALKILKDYGYKSQKLQPTLIHTVMSPCQSELNITLPATFWLQQFALPETPRSFSKLLWRFKTGYAVPQIFKQRKCKCSCKEYVACHGKQHKQTT